MNITQIETVYGEDGGKLFDEYMERMRTSTFDEMIAWLIHNEKDEGMKKVLSEFSDYYKKLEKRGEYPPSTPFDKYFQKDALACLSCHYMFNRIRDFRDSVDVTETFMGWCRRKIKEKLRRN